MSTIIGLDSEHAFAVIFGGDAADGSSEYVVAAVLWRRRLPRPPWREVLRNIFRPRRRRPDRAAAPGWPPEEPMASASEGDGEREVVVFKARRIVRVLGGDYPLPGGEGTLVLLVDEPGAPETAAVVDSLVMSLPHQPRTWPDRSLGDSARAKLRSAESRRHLDAWGAALRADPRVASFWPGG